MPSKKTLCIITPSQTDANTFSWASTGESELLVIAYSWLVPPFFTLSFSSLHFSLLFLLTFAA